MKLYFKLTQGEFHYIGALYILDNSILCIGTCTVVFCMVATVTRNAQ